MALITARLPLGHEFHGFVDRRMLRCVEEEKLIQAKPQDITKFRLDLGQSAGSRSKNQAMLNSAGHRKKVREQTRGLNK